MDRGVVATAQQSLDAALDRELEALEAAGLLRSLRLTRERDGAKVTVDEHRVVDFSSNDYLGLASDPRVRGAFAEAVASDPPGATASRSLGGNHPAHTALEEEVARLKGTAAALLFPSGYSANLGVIPALAGSHDAIYSDALNHASIVDGCRLARAQVQVFPHADLDTLTGLLHADRGRYRRRVIIVEGVYSMDGDLCPLPDLVALAERFDAVLYVDDAHASGTIGLAGGGSADHWGLPGTVAVTVGTLGKAFGTAGAFVAGSGVLRQFLLNRARSFVFSTGPSPALARATLAALAIAREEPWRRERLWANAEVLRAALAATGRRIPANVAGHIIPIAIGDADLTTRVGRALLGRGFLVGAIRPPTVPPRTARLRVTVSAAHDPADIEHLVEALDQCCRLVTGGTG